MGFLGKYIVTQKFLTPASKRRSGLKMSPGVKFIVAHDTGNPESTARGNVAYYERTRDEESASAHIFVDDKEILECIPALTDTPEKAWHVRYNVPTDNTMFGFDANDTAIGVEYCYGPNIDADDAYRKYIWVLAYLCSRFHLGPTGKIIGHCFLDPLRRTDPVTGLLQSRRTYDQLLRDVALEYDECIGKAKPAISITKRNGTVEVAHRLNIRESTPSTRAHIVQTVTPGTKRDFIGWTDKGEQVNNISKWYQDVQGNFFWSGGVK